MLTAIIDYESGNLHSAQKAFEKMAHELDAGRIVVTSDPDVVSSADRIVLPGDGAFPACHRALTKSDVYSALYEAVETKGRPFLGICVGMQLMALNGFEYEQTPGLGWIQGNVRKIAPENAALKVPHMGWNDLVIDQAHPILDDIQAGQHVYFVHSYQMEMQSIGQRIAHVEYGGDVTAIVANANKVGLQFHPEKSAATGLQMIGNFLKWAP